MLGLILDPKERATIQQVVAGSVADKDGFQVGDEITQLSGQPILSIADVQWVLHHADASKSLKVEVRRKGQTKSLKLSLPDDLRRMTLGGVQLESLPEETRVELKLPKDQLALRAKHVGQYNEHAVAKRAGFLNGDIIVAIDGDRSPQTETSLMARLAQTKRPGDQITFSILRGQQKFEFRFAQQ